MRKGYPIELLNLKEAVNTQIEYSLGFLEWEAAIAAGATLTELYDWWRGERFPPRFKTHVIAWYKLHELVQLHAEAAARETSERKARRKGTSRYR